MTKEKVKKENSGKKYTYRLKDEFNKKILPALMKILIIHLPWRFQNWKKS